jgi:SAM-dependent methyltransferase
MYEQIFERPWRIKEMKVLSDNRQIEFWEEQDERRSPTHPVVKAFVDPKIKYISKHITLSPEKKVLDVGCGNGYFTFYFSEIFDTTGLDFSQRMLKLNPTDNLIQGSVLSLPFKNNSFDIVFCSNLLHHVEKPIEAILEMKRVSRECIISSEPNRNNFFMALFNLIIPEERGALKFSRSYMEKIFRIADIYIVNSCSMGSIVPNKTPLFLLSLLQKFDLVGPFGFYNIIIGKKRLGD